MEFKVIFFVSICSISICYNFSIIAQELRANNSFIECGETSIDYNEDGNLSAEERIARMDEAFFESLRKYDSCQLQQNNQNASDTASGVSGREGNAGIDGSGTDGSSAQGQSIASNEMSGDEPEADVTRAQFPLENQIPLENQELSDPQDVEDNNGAHIASGKIPDDIPPADNDTILESQIRYAAENEADPIKRTQLWDEYRKYKGLPRASQ